MGMTWATLATVQESTIKGERFRTSLCGTCPFERVEGTPLIIGAVERGWGALLELCLLHMYPRDMALSMPGTAPPCCRTAAARVAPALSYYEEQVPPEVRVLHRCALRSPPHVFTVWNEWDECLPCLPPSGDPGWAYLWYTWIEQRQPVNAQTALGWCIALQRMNVAHIGHLTVPAQVAPCMEHLKEIMAQDDARVYQFQNVPMRIQEIEAWTSEFFRTP